MDNEILNAEDKDFNRVWEIMKEVSAAERHFNELETKYRILASQWLLASFAGIGFVLTAKTDLPFNNLWVVIGICLVSAVGIFQLWRMDLIVYHQLLHAAFSEGVKLENTFPFLPQIKNQMLHSQKGSDVTKSLVYYYSGSVSLLLVMGGVAILVLKYSLLSNIEIILIIFSLSAVTILINIYMRKKSVEKSSEIKIS